MKIYTKKGDSGLTQTLGGERVLKNDLRITLNGELDEVNSFLGLFIEEFKNDSLFEEEQVFLFELQRALFSLGSLVSLLGTEEKVEKYDFAALTYKMEKRIDFHEEKNTPLKSFILPGGSRSNALANVVRCKFRRVERLMSSIEETSFFEAKKFLNRSSDYFFVLGRRILREGGNKEVIWSLQAE